MKKISIRSLVVATVVGVAGVAMVGCTTTPESAQASPKSGKASLDA